LEPITTISRLGVGDTVTHSLTHGRPSDYIVVFTSSP